MSKLLERNLDFFKHASRIETKVMNFLLNICDEDDVKEATKNRIDLAKAVRKTIRKYDAGETVGSEYFNKYFFLGECWTCLYEEILAHFPKYKEAIDEYQDDDEFYPTAECRFEKSHCFKFIENSEFAKHKKQITTKRLFPFDQTICLVGVNDIWDEIDAFRLVDLDWLIKAVANMECGEIKIE